MSEQPQVGNMEDLMAEEMEVDLLVVPLEVMGAEEQLI